MEGKNAVKIFPAPGKERRPYGKAPLEFGLPEALETVGKIAQEGKSMSESKLAIILGNTITSSAFTRKIRALICYGLLEQQPDGLFTMTELALAITLPRSPESQAEAKTLAFLNIDLFRSLFSQHKGKLLPADEFLRNILEQESGVPREVSQEWVKQFKDGARTAGLFYSRSDGKIQISESPAFHEAAVAVDAPTAKSQSEDDTSPCRERERTGDRIGPDKVEAHRPSGVERVSGHHTRIDLSDGRRAEIIIPDRLTARDAKKLKRALEGVAVIIESMVSEEGQI